MTTQMKRGQKTVRVHASKGKAWTCRMEMHLGEKGTISKSKQASVRFGSVHVKVASPSMEETVRNIEAGKIAFARAKTTLVKPGVRVEVAKGVPLFRADPKNPGTIVRFLNGIADRGKFVQGVFKPIFKTG